MKGNGCVVPPSVSADAEALKVFVEQAEAAGLAYEKLLSLGIPKEDARFILPHGGETRIVVTMNARELNHFFALRCCNRAQWEIRDVAWQMLKLAHEAAPALFDECGPECLRGRCPEGKMCCGRMDEVRARYDREIAGKTET